MRNGTFRNNVTYKVIMYKSLHKYRNKIILYIYIYIYKMNRFANDYKFGILIVYTCVTCVSDISVFVSHLTFCWRLGFFEIVWRFLVVLLMTFLYFSPLLFVKDMCIYIYIYIYIYIHTHTNTKNVLCVWECSCLYIYIDVYLHTCMYVVRFCLILV